MNKSVKKIMDSYLYLVDLHNSLEISVSDITNVAGISRATFYNHFNSVEDVISCIEESVDAKILECINNHPNGVTKGIGIIDVISNEILPLIYENREILKILYTSPLHPYWIDYLKANYSKWVSSFKSEYDCRTVPSYYAENLTYLFFFFNNRTMGFKAGSGNTSRIQENLSFIVFRSHQSTIVTLKTAPSCVITDMNAKRGRSLPDGP